MMQITILHGLIFISLFLGFLLLFNINPFTIKGPFKKVNISFMKAAAKQKRIRINAASSLSRLEKFAIRLDALLLKINRKRGFLYFIASLCFITGLAAGFVYFSGLLLSLATGIAFIPLTYLYLLFVTQEASRDEVAELQNTMSIITNAYLADNNIIKAFEVYLNEKNRFVDEGHRVTTPFDVFVFECLYMDTNIESSLVRLAAKINNRYFDQWVRNLRLCIENKHMRFSLQPVIDAMADEKIMQIESDAQMVKTWQMYLSTVAVMFSVVLVFRFAQEDWYNVLVHTPMGKFLIILMLLSALISALFVMRVNKPVSTI